MNDDQLGDLKQFIDSRISQSEQLIRTDMTKGFTEVNQKVDNGFAGIGEAIEEINNKMDTSNASVDQRLTALEPKTV